MAIEQLDILLAWLLSQCLCPWLCPPPGALQVSVLQEPFPDPVRSLLLCIILYL